MPWGWQERCTAHLLRLQVILSKQWSSLRATNERPTQDTEVLSVAFPDGRVGRMNIIKLDVWVRPRIRETKLLWRFLQGR